jgi:putative toxin-antitoxin system antitoxin component (TIGR02293 family)
MKPSPERSTARPKKGASQSAGTATLAEGSPKRTGHTKIQALPKRVERHVEALDRISVAFEGSSVMAHDVVMKGVSGRALTRIWETTRGSLPPDAILKAIGVSERTAHRIKADPDKPLDVRTTDGIYRLESVRAMAEEVLGSAEAANEWLSNEAMGLEFRKPIDLLSTSPGAEAVKTLLQRMKYGVYA